MVKPLAEGANETVRPKLYGILLHGITNLGKSASTVQLQVIEQMASNLLPILHDVGRQEPHAMSAALQSLQAGLDRITLAVRRLAEDQEDNSVGIDNVPVERASELVQALPGVEMEQSSLSQAPVQLTVNSSVPLLDALRNLQQARARSLQPARDVLEAVIQRAEGKPNVWMSPALGVS